MPLGIVKNEDYEKELGSPKVSENISQEEVLRENSIPEVISEQDYPGESGESTVSTQEFATIGRGRGNTEVPVFLRKLIGESAIEEGAGAANAIGEFLGLSKSSVSAYSNGATSTATYNKPDKDLESHLDKTRKRITKRASGKLFKALGVIDDDKLQELNALEASTVAKNMAAIVKNMEPDDRSKGNTFTGPVITFYAPHIVHEDRFDVINVSE